MFLAAGAVLPGPVTFFTDELANWRADPKAKNNFSYKFTTDDRRKGGKKGGKAPVKKKKAPNSPLLMAAIEATAQQVVCCRGEEQAEQCRSSVRCR
jgi:hypothetical protein